MRNDSSAATVVSAEPDVLAPLARVSETAGLDPLAERLLDLRAFLADDLQGLDHAIAAIDEDVARLAPVTDGKPRGDLARLAARHLLDRPGKRIRPMCVLLAARLGGRRLDAVVRDLAIACELVHAATLLHDDVIDEGKDRRGAPTARMVYGNSASILGGDHLLIDSLRRVERAGYPALLKSLLAVIAEMVSAEAMQLEQRNTFIPDREVYLRVINGKTAALFRWGLYAGGVAAGLEHAHLEALGRAGDALGMAFQLVDDLLDLDGDPAETGKTPLTDLREGKLTWPVLVAAERDRELALDLERHVRRGAHPEESADAQRLVHRIRATGALEATREHADLQGEKALAEIARLPEGRARHAIELVVAAAVHRNS